MIPLIHLKHPFLIKNDLVKYDNPCYIDKSCDNPYITEFPERTYSPKEEIDALQETGEEEIAETVSSLDEKQEESNEQKEEEWSSYPCSPSNDSNSSNLTLFDFPPRFPNEDECYVPMDSLEISLFDKTDMLCLWV